MRDGAGVQIGNQANEMQTLEPRVSGTRDYIGEDAVGLRTVRDAIEAAFRKYAYAWIDPPILERSSPFLDRSGEDIRRRMYIFPDPGGREVCLRPELTIPACRTYLRQLQAPEDETSLSPEREARLCYMGPAFRYESTSEGRYRQFYQAGAELIGAKKREAADAEILALSLDALDAAGLPDPLVEVGDLAILHAFIDGLSISERSKGRLRRLALRNRKGEAKFLADVFSRQSSQEEEGTDLGELAALLASVEPAKAELLIREVLSLADVRHVGGRTPEEVVERLISRTAQQSAEPISQEVAQGIVALLDIRADPDRAFRSIEDHFEKFGIGSARSVIAPCAERLKLLEAYRGPTAVEFNTGLRRGLEYYTGFVFEVFARDLAHIGHLCGGGRYDNLLEALGANLSVPAVGFAIGLDRLLVAIQRSQGLRPAEARRPDALVVAAGAVRHEDCISITVALRNAGWSVETDTSGRRARSVLNYAIKQQIPYVVFVGEDELKNGQVRVKRLADRNDALVGRSSLAEYAGAEKARWPARAT
jgi:ATP phosphoribosyltransferase regulatory subunit